MILSAKMDQNRLSNAFSALVDLVEHLRGPGGCPWDARQSDSTVKIYLLEEAYEVLEAIDRSSPEDVCSELGDLLFQILFLAKLAAEREEFDLLTVIERIQEKMIRRHPHVFGETEIEDAAHVEINWAKIKQAEKGSHINTSSLLKSIPKNMPGLLRAHRLSERASKAGFDWANANEVWDKVREECNELKSAISKNEKEAVGEEIGDLLFSIVNLARHCGLNAEQLLRMTNQKFTDRFERMEREIESSGIGLRDASTDKMNEAWERVKDREE